MIIGEVILVGSEGWKIYFEYYGIDFFVMVDE